MAKERSHDNRYPSRYSSDMDANGFAWVTGRQYIVELICENKALQNKYKTGSSQELPRGFYTKSLGLAQWQEFYTEQINNRSLTKLIEKHTVDKIVAFLKENRYIMSLRPKWVHEKIDNYSYTATTPANDNCVSYDFNKPKNFTTNNDKKSIISKLEELE